MPSIAAVIPVKNGYPEIKDCIEGLLNQTVKLSRIVVIDSGSTDGTIEYLKRVKEVELLQIPVVEFNHGETRNIGWKNCTEDFLFYTVQDARPVNDRLIEELLKGFTDDAVAAVCGQQVVPHETDKNPVEWFRPQSATQIIRHQFGTAGEFEQLSPEQKKSICGWDNVAAMYRSSVLKEIPFQRVVFGEDMNWAKRAVTNGHAIVYNQQARVYHYHQENDAFTFKRTLTTLYFRYKEFGLIHEQPALSLRSKLSMIKLLLKTKGISTGKKISWYQYNVARFKARVRAFELFSNSLQKGEKELDAVHEQYCGKAPVPQKTI